MFQIKKNTSIKSFVVTKLTQSDPIFQKPDRSLQKRKIMKH
jgi:hypothetical protein